MRFTSDLAGVFGPLGIVREVKREPAAAATAAAAEAIREFG